MHYFLLFITLHWPNEIFIDKMQKFQNLWKLVWNVLFYLIFMVKIIMKNTHSRGIKTAIELVINMKMPNYESVWVWQAFLFTNSKPFELVERKRAGWKPLEPLKLYVIIIMIPLSHVQHKREEKKKKNSSKVVSTIEKNYFSLFL